MGRSEANPAPLRKIHWRKVWRQILRSRALRRAPVEYRWLWIALLLLPEDYDGRLVHDGLSLTLDDLADEAALDPEVTRAGLEYFIECNMLAVEDDTYRVVNFKHYQLSPEAERKRRQRETTDVKKIEDRGQMTEDRDSRDSPVTSPVTSPSLNPESDSEFIRVWDAYPKHQARVKAFSAWMETAKVRPPTNDLVAIIEAQAATEDWRKDNFRWVPHLARYLRERRWNDEVPEDRESANSTEEPPAYFPFSREDVLEFSGSNGKPPHPMWDSFYELYQHKPPKEVPRFLDHVAAAEVPS